jgi:hypothetical protein
MKYTKVEKTDRGLLARSLSVRIRDKNVQTPIRALHLTGARDCEARRIRNPKINELYKSIAVETLRKIDGDIEKQQEFTASFTNAIQSGDADALNLLFFSCVTKDGKIPSRRETEYLFDLSNVPNSDVLIPPIVRDASGEEYLEFLDQFFTVYETINHRPIMGLIPYLSYRELDPILKFYEKHEVVMFAMDLHGKPPLRLTANISRVLRTLRRSEGEYGEAHYLHGLNVGQGRALASQIVKPAKDILAFEMGFDSFGPAHIPPKLTPDLYGKLERSKKPPIRLFNRHDYGYYSLNVISSRNFPQEQGIVGVGEFKSSRDYEELRRLQKIFNAERQTYEADTVRSRMIDKGGLERYLSTKTHVKDLVKGLSKLADSVKQSTL